MIAYDEDSAYDACNHNIDEDAFWWGDRISSNLLSDLIIVVSLQIQLNNII